MVVAIAQVQIESVIVLNGLFRAEQQTAVKETVPNTTNTWTKIW